jgi:hypothetical protein
MSIRKPVALKCDSLLWCCPWYFMPCERYFGVGTQIYKCIKAVSHFTDLTFIQNPVMDWIFTFRRIC